MGHGWGWGQVQILNGGRKYFLMEHNLILSHSSWHPPCQAHNRCSVNELNWTGQSTWLPEAADPCPGVCSVGFGTCVGQHIRLFRWTFVLVYVRTLCNHFSVVFWTSLGISAKEFLLSVHRWGNKRTSLG